MGSVTVAQGQGAEADPALRSARRRPGGNDPFQRGPTSGDQHPTTASMQASGLLPVRHVATGGLTRRTGENVAADGTELIAHAVRARPKYLR